MRQGKDAKVPIDDLITAAMRDASRGDLSTYSAGIAHLRATTTQVKPTFRWKPCMGWDRFKQSLTCGVSH